MFDAEVPGREPDAILYAPPHDQALWTLPWVAASRIDEAKDGPPGERQVRLWFQPSDALPKAQDLGPRAPVPDRPHDLEVYNAGFAPPEGFWRVHPAVEAFEVEYDKGDGANWWVRLWLKAA